MLATFTVTKSGTLAADAVLTIDGRDYPIPNKTRRAGHAAPARIGDTIEAAGYRPVGGYYSALRGTDGIEVEPR